MIGPVDWRRYRHTVTECLIYTPLTERNRTSGGEHNRNKHHQLDNDRVTPVALAAYLRSGAPSYECGSNKLRAARRLWMSFLTTKPHSKLIAQTEHTVPQTIRSKIGDIAKIPFIRHIGIIHLRTFTKERKRSVRVWFRQHTGSSLYLLDYRIHLFNYEAMV